MQPYFAPYAGYFRLMATADVFVVYDCVQFPRRGWVHRNQLTDTQGNLRWLTLPIASCPQDTRIDELEFHSDAASRMQRQLRRFPCLTIRSQEWLDKALTNFEAKPVEYICHLLQVISRQLGCERPMLRSSELNLPPYLRGAQRILEITRRLGATRYVNAPGGRELYSAHEFEDAGVELSFLSDYIGSKTSILERLTTESHAAVAREIENNMELCAA